MSRVLAINAGSSSVKFAVFAAEADQRELLRGHVDGTGADARLFVDGVEQDLAGGVALRPMPMILGVLKAALQDHDITVVSHRIVHGGAEFTHPEFLTSDVMKKLTALEPLAPLHQPHDLAIVRDAVAVFPNAAQVGCFDTAFHAGKPLEANCYALPRALYTEGVRRYGFHGLSYDYISGELRARHPDLATGRVVIAHLGSGA
ncbi:MAG: acetate kinase [Polaromonas sp.]